MAKLLLPSEAGSLSDIDVTQGGFRAQLDVVTTLLRQLGGDADSARDLLVSRFTIYVNPEIGRDTFVGGDVPGVVGLSIQETTCGYSPFSPFKTLQRAFLEAARISIVTGPGNDQYDRVVIRVASGNHVIGNGGGGGVTSWGAEKEPTQADLDLFNTAGRLGVILPRGVSVIGEDLRKSVIRPAVVPAPSGNPSTGRGAIFRATGGGFFFTFTFKDDLATTSSHHMLHCFEFCNETDLVDYYNKVATAFGLTPGDAEVRPGETQIAAPYPPGNATPDTDTTFGSSCYVFSCSLRSDYGLCGIYLDGDEVTGFKSMVTAQFTNVSLQRDMNAWQVYSGGTWSVPASYTEYINANLNDVRYRVSGVYDPKTGCHATDWRHFGFKCINNAIIQEVSCFVIGDAVHHWTASGGECTITNSNSNFGATALMSSGFKGIGKAGGAFQQDTDFSAIAVRRPAALRQNGTNIREISIGLVKAYDPATGVLTLDRAVDIRNQLEIFGYSLAGNTYLWIENQSRETGPGAIPGNLPNSTAIPVRALMEADPWDPATPDEILLQVSTDQAINNIETVDPDELLNNRVYIRRLVDNRGEQEREYSLTVINSKGVGFRRPVGNFILRLSNRTRVGDQLDPTNGPNQLFIVSDATPLEVSGTSVGAASDDGAFRLVLRPGDSQGSWNSGQYYRLGQAVFNASRVKRSKRNAVSTAISNDNWADSYSMLTDQRGVEQSRLISAPLLVIDRDSDPDPDSVTLGISLTDDDDVLQQIRSAPDYIAVAELMIALGYSEGDVTGGAGSLAGSILEPQRDPSRRNWDPRAAGSPTPAGKLTSKQAWPLEFNRPSLIRAFGHAYEWAGFMNYTKAMPRYQTSVLSDQHKVDFFAVNHFGGRCYNTGFNEDGLIVQGDIILDLATGRRTSVDVAGLGGLSGDPNFEDIPDTFQNLTVTEEFNSLGRANINNVVFNGFIEGSPTWAAGVLPRASTDEAGVTRLSTVDEAQRQTDDNIALTPFAWGQLGNIPLGWLELDANGLVPPDRLPPLDASLLPAATTTQRGAIEIATNTESLGNDSTRALVPSNIQYLKNIANGLVGLNSNGLVLRNVLPIASQSEVGAQRFATNAEALAYSSTTNAISPETLNYLRARADGLASLDATGKVPPNQLPKISLANLPIQPVAWIPNAQNWENSINFFFEHTSGTSIALGTPQTSGYEGASGFLYITNTSGQAVTGITGTGWKEILNTWIDPTTTTTGLAGDLLIGYYIASSSEVIYNVLQVS